jgi:redox-sensitive bicupin YhaK (pirin superfamily)
MPAFQRQIVRVSVPATARHGAHFEALRMGGDMFGREGDPWFNLDHFRMAGPTFPPHPHAGFSAVTYVLPESPGAIANRDSRGDRSLIGPGGVHWTAAGHGIVHEEIPATPGTFTEGFQIFIRQPADQESQPPAIAHVDGDDVPIIRLPGGGSLRVIAGDFEGQAAPFTLPSPLSMFDLSLDAGQPFRWSPPVQYQSLAIYLFAGAFARCVAPALLVFAPGDTPLDIDATEDGTRFLVMAGIPLNAPSVSNGPFVLSSRAALEDAVQRYRSGAMGALPPDWD